MDQTAPGSLALEAAWYRRHGGRDGPYVIFPEGLGCMVNGVWGGEGGFYYVWWTVSITNTGMKSTSGRHTSKAWEVATFLGFCYYLQTIPNFFW